MKNTKMFLMEKAGKIKSGGLGLGLVFLTIAVAFSAIVFTSRIAASEIQPAANSSVYYTNDAANIDLPLNETNIGGDKFVVFTKTDTTYSFHSYAPVGMLDTKVSIQAPGLTQWVLGAENDYYVGFTTEPEEIVELFDGFQDRDQTDLTNPTAIQFEHNGATITLQLIKVVFDNSSPVISKVSVTSDKTLKSSDTITMTFDIADAETGVFDNSIAVTMNSVSPESVTHGTVGNTKTNTYTAVFKASSFITDLQNGDSFPYMNIKIDAKDMAGNAATQYSEINRDCNLKYDNLQIADIHIISSNSKNSVLAKTGDTITLYFKTNIRIANSDITAVTIGGHVADDVSSNDWNQGYKWKATYRLKTGDIATDNSAVPISITITSSEIIKTATATTDLSAVIFYAEIAAANLEFKSDFASNPAYAVEGSNLYVTFTTTHPVNVYQSSIEGHNVTFTSEGGNKMKWTASYEVENTPNQDGKYKFSFRVNDDAGNAYKEYSQASVTSGIIYADVLIAVTTNNINPACAADNNAVTLTVTSVEALTSIDNAKIAGIPVVFKPNGSNTTWTATQELTSSAAVTDKNAVSFSFNVNGAGQQKTQNSVGVTSNAIYYAPIQLSDLAIKSDNAVTSVAQAGNWITLSFTTQHAIEIPTGEIANNTVTFINSSGDNVTWEAHYQLEASDTADTGNVSFSLEAKDKAGNTATETKALIPVKYYASIQLSDVVMRSKNTNPSSAKNGDVITLSFRTQHETATPIGEIAGESVPFTNISGDKMTWEATVTLPDGSVQDLAFIPFSFSVKDDAGNTAGKTQDDLISANKVIYYAPLIQSDLKFYSNNADPKQAASGNTMTVTFKVQHEISMPVGTIAGQTAIFTNVSGDKMTWQGSYKLVTGNVADTDKVSFALKAADTAGNTISTTESNLDNSNQVHYLDMLQLTDVLFVSDNSASNLAKDGNTVTISFRTQHAVYTPVGTIAGQTVIFTNASGDKMVWQASSKLTADIVQDQAIVPFTFAVKDASGNETAKSQSDIAGKVIYEAALEISGLNIVSNNEVPTLALAGNTVSVTFKSQHAIAAPAGLVAGKSVTFTNPDGDKMTWQGIYQLQLGDVPDNGIIPFSLSASDSAGNTVSKTNSDLGGVNQVTYYAPISALNITFTSDNERAGERFAKDTDIVTLRFQTTHPVIISSGYIAGQQVSITSVNNNKMDWVASYTVKNKEITDNTDITFAGVITDQAGNTLLSISQADTQKIRYQAPIAEGLSVVSFVSDNAKTGTNYAKNGDSATLSFTTTHPVMLSDAQINGNTGIVFSSTDNDNMHWTAKYTIPENALADNTDISFAFTLNDASANTSVAKTQSDAGKIRYQAPISIKNLSLVSDNGVTAAVAKNTNKITLTFQTLHPVVLTTVRIAGQDVACSSTGNDGMTWSAGYIVQSGMTADNAVISLSLLIDDLAGNTAVTATENDTKTEKIIYYAPIVVSNVSISTTNSNDAARYAKDADAVYVTFMTNHDTSISDASIAGKTPQVTKTDSTGLSKLWVLTYNLKNGDVPDLATVSFAFTIKDTAGNEPVEKTHLEADVSHSIQYFAPITATTSISSNGSNAVFAQNGDSITVSAVTNHAARVTASSIFARGTNNSGENSQQIAVAYTIPATESVLTEGSVPFSYTITDAAGNALSVKETNDSPASAVTYDRTKPQVEISPDFSGFTNQTVDFIISFSDVNLDSKGVSIKINGEEQITSSDRSSISGTAFTKKITVEADNTYAVDAAVTDKAGNQAESNARTTITIDKSNPEVSSVKIDFLTPKTYKKGFVLGEYLNITENNVDQIICTVTDSTGVHDWDINTPITTDGKNTVYLLVTDMAGNHSTALTYDLYIDGLAPKPMISDTITGEKLAAGTDNAVFISDMTLGICLEALNIGDEATDYFTVLKLVDKNGTLVVDLLNTLTMSADGLYTLPLDTFGEYTLLVEAQDAVGNVTGTLAYHFTFRDKSILQKYYENKPLFYSTISVLGVLAAGGIFLVIVNKRKNRTSPAKNHL